jgi:hypothetical protein
VKKQEQIIATLEKLLRERLNRDPWQDLAAQAALRQRNDDKLKVRAALFGRVGGTRA